MGNSSDKASATCAVCNRKANEVPGALISPGCCPAWYHQQCLVSSIAGGNLQCVACTAPIPNDIVLAAIGNNGSQVIAQPVPVSNVHAVPVSQMQNIQVLQQLPSTSNSNSVFNFKRTSPTNAQGLLEEDPAEPYVVPPVNVLPTSEQAHPPATLSIECTPELSQASTSAVSEFYATVSLFASSAPLNVEIPSTARPPMDLVCVLDTSGSMGSDNKLVNLKHAVNYIRSELGDKDRMSVITFETSSRIVHHLRKMNAGNKADTQVAIDSLRPGGGTRILSGLDAAYSILSNRTSANPIGSVFLLTDGIDSSELRQKKIVAKQIKDLGCSLFVFGFGNDHDSKHLKEISDAGEGLFTFVEKSDMVIDAFGGALGAEKSIFASNIALTINSANGTTITSVQSGNYRKVRDPSGSRAEVFFNNIMQGEQRDILLKLQVPQSEAENPSFSLLTTSVTYNVIGGDRCTTQGQDCVVARLAEEHLDKSITRNEVVDVQINRMLVAAATEESLALADRGEYAEAKKKLECATKTVQESSSALRGNVMVNNFAQELQEAMNVVGDRDVYTTKGGRSMMSEVNQTVSAQRTTYVKDGRANLYQNSVSAGFQGKANKSKAFFK